MTSEHNETNRSTFLAIDRGASDWQLRRARIADCHGSDAVDRVLTLHAADAQVTMARREVALYRRALGQPGLPRPHRRRLGARLAHTGAWLQQAFLTRRALDRPTNRG
jgi:hypothetical protein